MGRKNAASDLRVTLDTLTSAGVAGASRRALADRLGVSHAHVDRWCGDGDPAVALGDVEAMGTTVAIAVFERVLARLRAASLEGRRPRDLTAHALDLGAAAGRFAEEVRATCGESGVLSSSDLSRLEASALAAQSTIAAVLALCARLRAEGVR